MTIYGFKVVYGVHLTREQLYKFFEEKKKKDENKKQKDTRDVVCEWFENNQNKIEKKYDIIIWEIPHDRCEKEGIDEYSVAIGIDVARFSLSITGSGNRSLLIDLNYQNEYDMFLKQLEKEKNQIKENNKKTKEEEEEKDEEEEEEENLLRSFSYSRLMVIADCCSCCS